MVLVIQSVIGCILFTLVLIPAARNPVKYLSTYPLAVQKEVIKMPQYSHLSNKNSNRLFMTMIQSILFILIGIVLCLLAKTNDFYRSFVHMYLFFFIINIYDLVVIDWLLFCRLKIFRIPGTEDMDQEYKDYMHHFKVFIRGIIVGIIISLIVAFLVSVLN